MNSLRASSRAFLLAALMVGAQSVFASEGGPDAPRDRRDLVPPDLVATPRALRYHDEGDRLWTIGRALAVALPAAFLASGLSARLRDLARRVGGRRASTPLYAFAYLSIIGLAALPFDWYAGYNWPRTYGLTTQSPADWLLAWSKRLTITLGLGTPLIWGAFAVIRRFPRTWWAWLTSATFPVLAASAFLMPVVYDPLFHEFGPLEDALLETRLRGMAADAGIGDAAIYKVEMGRETPRANAYVTGFFGTRRIVLWDTLLEGFTTPEVEAVVAHEIGHDRLHHVTIGLLVATALIGVGLLAMQRVVTWHVRHRPGRFGVEGVGDPAILPLMLVSATGLGLVLSPIGMAASRAMERAADSYGLALTGDGEAAASAFTRLGWTNLSIPRPGVFAIIWRGSHPGLGERIDACRAFETARDEASPSGVPAVLDGGAALEDPAGEARLIRGPRGVPGRVVADLAREGVELGVEVVEVMERDRLGGHRELRAAELVGAVVADDHMFEPEPQLLRERRPREVRDPSELLAEDADPHDEVADELALVGVSKSLLIREFVELAEVVEEDPGEQEVAVEVGVEVGDPSRDLEHRGDVLQEATPVGVVVANPRGRGHELGHERLVDEEAIDQGAQVRVAEGAESLAGAGEHLGRVDPGLGEELHRVEVRGVGPEGLGDDQLERPLEELDLAADPDVIARVEAVRHGLARVPHSGADGGGLVPELQVEVRIPLAVGPDLLLGHEQDFFQGVAIGERIDGAT